MELCRQRFASAPSWTVKLPAIAGALKEGRCTTALVAVQQTPAREQRCVPLLLRPVRGLYVEGGGLKSLEKNYPLTV